MNETKYFQDLFLTFIYLKSIWFFCLNILNYNKINSTSEIPEIAKPFITPKDNKKAIEYNSFRLKWDPPIYVYNILVLIFWTLLGGLDSLDFLIHQITKMEMLNSLLFIGSFFIINYFLSLPIQLFNTFKVEKKFGFNNTTVKLFFKDQIKAFGISILIGLPIIYLVLYFVKIFPTNWWLYSFIFITLFQFLLIWIYPTFIAPLFNKFSKIDDNELKIQIEQLLKKLNFNSSGIFVMDASKRSNHSNAYFTGFGSSKKIVLYDTLINSLSQSELLAVLAHELGHFKKNHVIKNLIQGIIFSFFSFYLLSLLLKQPTFFNAHDVTRLSTTKGIILYFLVFDVYTFWTTPIFNYISRKYEFEADNFASKYSDKEKLISALFKLQKENSGILNPHPLYALNYYSHPSVVRRANALIKS